MWHLTYDTWQATSDTWHLTCDTRHMTHGIGCCTLWENLLIHSCYGLGMVEKWHTTPDTWHVTCDTWQVVSKCIIYPPCKYKTIWLGSKLSIFSKSPSFRLKLDLHCDLPSFRNVSNISAPPPVLVVKTIRFSLNWPHWPKWLEWVNVFIFFFLFKNQF